ncbi:leucyl aminopeptidase [Candidatus Acetothermia bacterium]|nr:leucyl aminopeptidase [Candidatus Acetothermia bacterium]MBI3642593.1 leucyl aminopeptidase [Candidatus Acetothermia bacterium]
MEIHVVQGDIIKIETEVLALGIFQGVQTPEGAAGAVDRTLDGMLFRLFKDGDFHGEAGETFLLRTENRLPAKRILLIGLGERDSFDLERARNIGAKAVQAASRFKELTTIVHGAGIGGLEPEAAAQACVEGSLLGKYRFDLYAEDRSKQNQIESLRIVEFDTEKIKPMRFGADRGQKVSEAVYLARDLANEPGEALPPVELAERARLMAEHYHLRFEALDEKELEREKLHGILGVARGSDHAPRLIVLEHNPKDAKHPIVLVGKGVTFDSGGISIKPREGMEAMKYDMAGAAAVIGALQAVAGLDLPLHVIGLIPAVENLPSGKAIKPGDIIRYRNGKTIEVVNTDAEGRLILADALLYAARFQPKVVVDLATLTGACVTALGKEAAGLFSNDTKLTHHLKSAAEATGERVWELPLYEGYKKLLKSEIASFKNSVMAPGRTGPAGAAVGALFLKEFVSYPWAHLDIAGMAWDLDKAYCPAGASGYGVRLLIEFLRRFDQNPL